MPTTIAPAGLFRQSYRLSLLVAQSTTFQSVVGAANATLALDHIFYPFADLESAVSAERQLPPRATIVEEDSPWGRQRKATDRGTWKSSGVLNLNFDFVIPEDVEVLGYRNSFNWMNNKVGEIMLQMEALSGSGQMDADGLDYFYIVGYTKTGPYELDTGKMEIEDIDDVTKKIKKIWSFPLAIEWE